MQALWRGPGAVLILAALPLACHRQAAVPGSAPASAPSAAHEVSRALSGDAPVAAGASRTVRIDDPAYQMPAASVDLPAAWQFAGQVIRPRGCHAQGVNIQYTAQSGDGLTAIEVMPGASWSWTDSPAMQQNMQRSGCPAVPAASPAEFLTAIALPALRPDAQLLAIEDVAPAFKERLASELEQRRQQNAAVARQYGLPPQQLTHEAKRARVRYQRNGQPVEELIVAVVDCTQSRMPGTMVSQPYTRRMCSSPGVVVQRAPRGQLASSAALFAAVRLNVEQAWQSRIAHDQQLAFDAMQKASWAQHDALMAQSEQAARDRTAAWAAGEAQRAQQVQSALNQDRARQAAMDRQAHEFTLGILNQGTYVNSATGQRIETNNQFQHTYQSADGQTILHSNDPGDPNRSGAFTQSFTEIFPQH